MNTQRVVVPPIKCQGIKTKVVPKILGEISKNFYGTWIEPFMGSGVVAFNVRPSRSILADANPHVVEFYKSIESGTITAACVRKYFKKEGV